MGLFQSLHGDCIRVHVLHWSKLRRASNWSTYFSTLIVPNLRMHHWLWCHWQKCWFSLDQVHDRRFVDACFMYTILLMCKSATYFTRPPTCATRYAVCLFVPAFNFTCSLPSHSARSTSCRPSRAGSSAPICSDSAQLLMENVDRQTVQGLRPKHCTIFYFPYMLISSIWMPWTLK